MCRLNVRKNTLQEVIRDKIQLYVTQLLHQPLYTYKIYKIYTLKH